MGRKLPPPPPGMRYIFRASRKCLATGQVAAPIDTDAPPPRRRRPLQPPWPKHLFRQERQRGIVKYRDEDVIQLLALSRVLALAGLTMSVLQPSETALRNTDFYDEET